MPSMLLGILLLAAGGPAPAEEEAWMPGRTEGRWRIVGQIIVDIQLPQ